MSVDVWVDVEARVNLEYHSSGGISHFLRHGYMSLELTDSARLAQATPQRCTCLVSFHGFKITRAGYFPWLFHVSSGGQTQTLLLSGQAL